MRATQLISRKKQKRIEQRAAPKDTYEVRRYENIVSYADALKSQGTQVWVTNSESMARQALAGSGAHMIVFKNGIYAFDNLARSVMVIRPPVAKILRSTPRQFGRH